MTFRPFWKPQTGYQLDSPDVLTQAGESISRPRIDLMTPTEQASLTKQGPPPGMFAIVEDDQQGVTLQQWVQDHWEVVADHPRGIPEMSLAIQAPFVAAGAGGITPAPRTDGDPSITTPQPGGGGGSCTTVSSTDPGPTGAGSFWFDPDVAPGTLYVRNSDNTAWSAVCS
jgi:hypothetical protein